MADRRRFLALFPPILAVAGLATLAIACKPDSAPAEPVMRAADMLGGQDIKGFAHAHRPIAFAFPGDHGAHPAFKSEWWYFTGNVYTDGGRAFGFQFTLFRSALAPTGKHVARRSAWATRQAWMAHSALTDVAAGQFHAAERFSRGAPGLAGVETRPFRAWLDDWRFDGDPPGCDDCMSGELLVATDHYRLRLKLENTQPPVLHGERGLSAKSPTPGNASYYYSFTRLRADGRVSVSGREYPVRGEAWFDHEWSTSALEANQSGWDWFSLQLADRSELMVFQLRDRDDPASNWISGTLIEADGRAAPLGPQGVSLEAVGRWRSATTQVHYPSRWRMRIPASNLELQLTPKLPNQELNLSFRYWEGAVNVQGAKSGRPITGHGYAEYTGYTR